MKRVVTIGGGTGSFVLLSGLKKYPIELSAIVSMGDDGGSTGMLRDELEVLPPGDVRQCLVALSDSSEELRELMNYRFTQGGLSGHSFGNLFLSALEKISGGMPEGIAEAAKILNVRGRVIPVTEGDMRLVAHLENGKTLHGESHLDDHETFAKKGARLKSIALARPVKAHPAALQAIREADMIILGPGDLFGSTLPNLLVTGVARAIRQSQARVVYVANLTNKRGQTDGWDIDRYVGALEEHIGRGRIDFVIWNTKTLRADLVRQYIEQEGAGALVTADTDGRAGKRTYRLVRAVVAQNGAPKARKGDAIAHTRSFIRHDPDRLAKVLTLLLEIGEYENILRDIV